MRSNFQIFKMCCCTQGLYPDAHGVLGNELYDKDIGRIEYGYDLYHYNESIVPIWVSY